MKKAQEKRNFIKRLKNQKNLRKSLLFETFFAIILKRDFESAIL